MTTLTEQERNAVTTACKYAMQDYGRVQSLPGLNLMSKEIKLLESALDKLSTAPKYNPCRLFRKGDIVTPCQVKGRWQSPAWAGHSGIHFTVVEDEDDGTMWVRDADSSQPKRITFAVFFRLITPVEELERYVVIHNDYAKCYEVCWKDDDEPDGRTGRTRSRTTFWYHNPPKTHTQEQAKAAAEAECARLNAEYRKEREND